MAHLADVDDLADKLHALFQLAADCQDYCMQNSIGSAEAEEDERGDTAREHLNDWLRIRTSTTLIYSAAVIRVVLDHLKMRSVDWVEQTALELESTGQGFLFKCTSEGDRNRERSLRVVCNKILHATFVSLPWTEVFTEGSLESDKCKETKYCYWSGRVELTSVEPGNMWKYDLEAAEFCRVVSELLHHPDTHEALERLRTNPWMMRAPGYGT